MAGKFKIQTYIVLSFLGVCILSSIAMYCIMLNYYSDIHVERNKDYGSNSVKLNAQIIEQWLDEKIIILNDISYKLKYTSLDDEDTIREILKDYVDFTKGYNSFYIGSDDKRFIDAKGWSPKEDYDVTLRPWYQAVQNCCEEEDIALMTYFDVRLHREVLGIAKKIEIQGEEVVICCNINIDEIVKRVESIEYFDTGFGFILDDHNRSIVAKPSQLSHEEETVINSISNSTEYPFFENSSFEVNDEEYTVVSYPIEKYGWNLMLVAKDVEFNAYQHDFLKKVNSIFAGILCLVIIFSISISKRISKPIEFLVSKVRDFAMGNLDESVIIKSNWEIGNLSIQLEKMRLNLRKILEKMEFESELLTINHNQLEEYLDDTKVGTAKFISMLAHDIKTPVTLIKGYAKGLQHNVATTEEKREQYMENIVFRADQIEKILSNNLENVYTLNNKMVLNLQALECGDFINTLISHSKAYIESAHRKFKVTIELQHEDGHVEVDILKIQRVMDNLLSNAIKFSQDEKTVHLMIYQEHKKLYVIIKDEGRGIPEDKIENIFEMFYKADTDMKGYGLGLCVCQSIIQAHGGKMFAQNREVGCEIGYCLQLIE